MTLSGYLDKVRFFLRDFYGVAYPQQELIDCINQARADVVSDSFVTRGLCIVPTVPNQVNYTFATVLNALQQQIVLPSGQAPSQVVSILNISVFWSATLKPALDYMEWGDLNAWFGSFIGFTFIPSVWGMYDLQTFTVYPIPNSVYNMEIDCTFLPNSLAQPNDIDLLPPTIADFTLVPYRAAAIAKNHQHAYGESARFDQMYKDEFERRFSGFPAFRIPSRYGNDPRRP